MELSMERKSNHSMMYLLNISIMQLLTNIMKLDITNVVENRK